MVKVNYREVARVVAKSPIGRKRIETFARQRFARAKEEMLQDFDDDPVTVEISEGSRNPEGAPNISRTLPGGRGNLYSFIGFPSNPIPQLREALDKGTSLIASTISSDGDLIKCKFSVRVETADIQKASPLPFETGKSWAYGIEQGISGFSRFLAGRFPTSISGGGIQAKGEVREQEYQPTPYISKILRKLTARLRNR